MDLRIAATTLLLSAPMLLSKAPVPGDGKYAGRQHVFTKSPEATTRLKTSVNEIGLWVDMSKWGPDEPYENDMMHLNDVTGHVSALVITKSDVLHTRVLNDFLLSLLKSLDPAAKITFWEFRDVNGRWFTAVEYLYALKGVPRKGIGYLYSGSAGTVLALGSTDQNQFPQYAEEITQLLNGLEITNTTQQSSANREGILPAPGFLKLTPKVAVSYNPKLWEPEELNSDHYHFRYISDASGAFASIGTDEVPLVTTDGLPVPLENLTDFWAAAARQNGYPPSNRLQREAQG